MGGGRSEKGVGSGPSIFVLPSRHLPPRRSHLLQDEEKVVGGHLLSSQQLHTVPLRCECSDLAGTPHAPLCVLRAQSLVEVLVRGRCVLALDHKRTCVGVKGGGAQDVDIRLAKALRGRVRRFGGCVSRSIALTVDEQAPSRG